MNEQTSNPLDALTAALQQLSATPSAPLKYIEFKGSKTESNYGKGIIFTGHGNYTKQIVLAEGPDRFFVSENIDLAKQRQFSINGVKVLDSGELGPGVTKSNLRQVGRLNGLIVDGSVSINQYLFYNASADRLGLGTDAPNAAFSVAEDSIEVMMGTTEELHGMVGTFASTDFDIVTDNKARITVKANGDIVLGKEQSKVTVKGKLGINVSNPDPNVDLHVAGPIKIHNRTHKYDDAPPKHGNHNIGDIVWNAAPRANAHVGWICVRAGDPGVWHPFGEIKERL